MPCQLVMTLSTAVPEGREGEKQFLYLKYSQSKCEVKKTAEGTATTPEKYTASFAWGNGNFYLAEDVGADE